MMNFKVGAMVMGIMAKMGMGMMAKMFMGMMLGMMAKMLLGPGMIVMLMLLGMMEMGKAEVVAMMKMTMRHWRNTSHLWSLILAICPSPMFIRAGEQTKQHFLNNC